MDRRNFFKTSALAVGATRFLTAVPASATVGVRRPAPSDRITMAVIGTGNQGIGNMLGFLTDPRVQVVAVCDVNRQSAGYWNGNIGGRDPARQIVDWHYAAEIRSGTFSGCASYEDYREVIARPDVDVIMSALPDHWHGLTTVEAAMAGKDIYCEKPLSLTVAEGRAMSDSVKKYSRVLQTGSQQRSGANFRQASELVRNGRLGRLHTIRIGMPGGQPDFGRSGHRKDPEPIPAGFNYDLWLGPAPEAPYVPARCHVNFRWIRDYSGGQVTDWGGHHPDIAQWALGMDHSGPIAIRNARGVFPDGLWNTATEYHFEAEYQNGVTMIVSDRERSGITFQGDDGWIHVARGSHEVSSPEIWNDPLPADAVRLPVSENHFRNFIDCVVSRQEPVAPVEAAHRSITIAHLGNIAMLLGRDLRWDPVREQVANDPQANGMLSRPMRAPWKMPVI
jgi:predicted dehydrogenase